MADDTTPDTPTDAPAPEAAGDQNATATAEGGEEPVKFVQTVEISEAGPCRKHIKVTVERKQIDDRFNEKFTELTLSDQPQVRGFRPGKAPRKIIERQYYPSVA